MQKHNDRGSGANPHDPPLMPSTNDLRLAHCLGDLPGGYCASCRTQQWPCDVRIHLDEMVAEPGVTRSTSSAYDGAGVPAFAKARP